MIPVTRTFLPPQQEYQTYLDSIWADGYVTNRGKFVLQLETLLKQYFNIPHLLTTNNGTIPLQIALKIAGGGGEIITTPFSFVASVSSIVWENCTPVFVDIHPEHLTIDEQRIEEAITPRTTCILATHVFGNPCDTDTIENIARRYNLIVIYDAAHCFGVNYKNKSLLSYGDMSTCSFHATKLFHTIEGGAIICNTPKYASEAYLKHNFGYQLHNQIESLGINAKMNEMQAAMGLTLLPYVAMNIAQRHQIVAWYNQYLTFAKYRRMMIRSYTSWNACYYPIIFESKSIMLRVLELLNQQNIFPRRYFYPSLNRLHYVTYTSMPIAEQIADTILCLPLFESLTKENVEKICTIINHEA